MSENQQTSSSPEGKKSRSRGYKCYVTYHPASVLKGGFHLEARIIEDLKRFTKRRLAGPRHSYPATHEVHIGFDTEYDSGGRLLTVGVATADCAEAIETAEAGWKKKVAPILKKAKVLYGHSVAGDLDYLVRLGLARNSWLRGDSVRDSFLLARMQDENRGKGAYGLEALLLSEFNFTPWKAETEKLIKATGNAADWSPEQRVARCRLDAWATRVLAEQFERSMRNARESDD